MRVAFAIGKPDSAMTGASAKEAGRYWTSSIIKDLDEACKRKGWERDLFLIGQQQDRRARRPDAIVNLIAEPLVCGRALALLAYTAKQHELKVLNSVAATLRTARTALPALVKDLAAHAPLTTLWRTGDLAAHIEGTGHRWPVLLRPPGVHGSKGLQKIDVASGSLLRPAGAEGTVVSYFIDFKSPVGLYRKYRSVWVAGALFRRHLIISDTWNISGAARAFMVGKEQLIAEEKAFLAGAGGVLDATAAALFAASGLDFGVIDFAHDVGGRLIVFELNGSFQISGSIPDDKRARWGYLEDTNTAILDALTALIAARAGTTVS